MGPMADQPDRPDQGPDAANPAHEPVAPPVKKAPAARKPAAAKKVTPAKKAPVKKAPAKAADGSTAAKKAAPVKQAAPAKKAPATTAPPAPVQLAKTNGDLTSAAKEVAAQAKSTVTSASNAVSGPPPAERNDSDSSRLPVAAALITGLLAILAVLYLARRNSEG